MNEMRRYIDIVENAGDDYGPYNEHGLRCETPPDEELSDRGRKLRDKCGKFIGMGSFRCVYEYEGQPNKVIKCHGVYDTEGNNNGCGSNEHEHEVWNTIQKFPGWSDWFAPVLEITPCGYYLVMPKCKHAAPGDVPELIPTFFNEIHDPYLENCGILNGRFVLMDMSYNDLYNWDHIHRMHGMDMGRPSMDEWGDLRPVKPID